MLRLLTICLASLVIYNCTDRMANLPEYWEYSPDQWIVFNKNFKLKWRNNETKVDKFRIGRVKVELDNKDIKELIALIRKKNIKDLIKKENALRKKIRFENEIVTYKLAEDMDYTYKDKKEPIPNFGEMYIYSIRTVKNQATSIPTGWSVILLDRSK